MAAVQYEAKEDAGRKFWTARYGRYAVRIDANRPGVYRWLITLERRSVRKVSPQSRRGCRRGERRPGRAAPPEAVDMMLADRELDC